MGLDPHESKSRHVAPIDIDTGSFECFAVANAPKGKPYGANILIYVRSRKQLFYGGPDGVWFLDPTKRTWIDAKPHGAPPAGIDHCGAYDSKRDRIYYHYQDRKVADTFAVYDVKTNTWTHPRPTGTGPVFSSSYESVFNYDTVNDRLVVIRLDETKPEPGLRRGVYVYDPQTNTWDDPISLPADVIKGIGNGNYGFYDPVLNAYFCHFASDSSDDGMMWVYRFKKAK